MTFKDRQEAGRKLGEEIRKRDLDNALLFALPRGGVSVAQEVANILETDFDVVIARKIGAPGHPEFGIGAISEESTTLFNPGVRTQFDLEDPEVKETIADEEEELRRRLTQYRQGRKLPELRGKTVILIDDGLATGATAAAAGKMLKRKNPGRLILAVPVGPRITNPHIEETFDEVICLERPSDFQSVGLWYEQFPQVDDEEVLRILGQHHPEKNLFSP